MKEIKGAEVHESGNITVLRAVQLKPEKVEEGDIIKLSGYTDIYGAIDAEGEIGDNIIFEGKELERLEHVE